MTTREANGVHAASVDPFADVDFSQLERSLRRPRTLADYLLNALVTVVTLSSLVPLLSVVLMLVWRGGRKLSSPVRPRAGVAGARLPVPIRPPAG